MAADYNASAPAWGGLTIPPATSLNAVGSSAAERQISVAAARAAVPLTYGEDRIAALILNVLPAAAGSNTLLVQCLWGFAGTSVGDVRLNDQALPTGASVTHYNGSQAAVDAALVAAFAAQGIVYTSTLSGFMYSVLALPTRAFDGQLNITGLVRGRKIYDPRRDSTSGGAGPQRLAIPSTWEWSDCPVLAQADFTASTVYGSGLLVDWSTVGPAATANDALVGVEKRRTLGITFLQPADVADMAETLRAYAGNFALPGVNGVRFVPDADGAAVASYSHAAGNIADIQPLRLRDMGTAPTAVEVIWTDTSKLPWRDASAIAQLPGAGTTKPWRLSQVRLPGITRYSQAMREATERLNKLTLNDLSTVIEVFDIGIRHDRGDLITLSHPLGLSNKPMRVNSVTMPAHGRWVLDVVEHDPAAYSNAVVTQPSIPDTNFVNPAGPPAAPANVVVTLVPGAARFTWSMPPEFDYAYTLIKTSTGSAPSDIQVNAGNGSSYDWLWPAVGSYSRWLVHVDTSGNPSAPTQVDFVVTAAIYVPGSSVVPEAGWLNSNVALPRSTLSVNPECNLPTEWVGSGCVFLKGVAGVPYGTAFGNTHDIGQPTFRSVTPTPIDRTRRLRVSCVCFSNNATSIAYLGVIWIDSSGNEIQNANAAGWGNGTYDYFGLIGATPPSSATRYSQEFGAGVPGVGIPANAVAIKFCFLPNYGQVGGARHYVTDFKLEDITDVAYAGTIANWSGVSGSGKPLDNASKVIDLGEGTSPGQRGSNDPPSFYSPGVTRQFKVSAAVGLGGADNYLTLETVIQYVDGSGGSCYQYAYRGTTTWRRWGACGANSWAGAWAQDLDRNVYTGDLDATKNVRYYQESDPGAVADGSLWISSTRSFERIGGAWRPYVGSGSIGTGELAGGSATEVVVFFDAVGISFSNMT